ncbi:hypothetical protein [Nocardia amamiensis]|uniref:hypothetical protein n=1 Tax=Nocardia amamiensis TaxID=404578 RepID=UPI000835D0D7|nr:hypothetical protein [Nocardia amamiensis]
MTTPAHHAEVALQELDKEAAQPGSPRDDRQPMAIGVVRGDVSGLHAHRHAAAVVQHARAQGYHYLYTVRPPQDHADPVGFALTIASGLGVAAIVVFDLATVDDRPALICDAGFDLETVCPGTTWARSARLGSGDAEAVA